MTASAATDLDSLLRVSARLGSESLLVQAATGNTSIKLGDVFWVKASGTWLADAVRAEILIHISLEETRNRIRRNVDPAGQTVISGGRVLATSVETAMHAVLPHRVVLHVHSVNTIAWAVRQDGAERLTELLDGIEWQWIPYVPSGLQLARAVEAAISRRPETCVFVLANHGLVICGEDCESAEALLDEVEKRVAISARRGPEPGWALLSRLAASGVWRVPPSIPIQAMGADPVARRILAGGVLYPCQAIFLSVPPRSFACRASCAELAAEELAAAELAMIDEPFVMVEDVGTLGRQDANPTESATLAGLALVLQRIPESAPVRYLNDDDVRELQCADVYRYRMLVEDNSQCRSQTVQPYL